MTNQLFIYKTIFLVLYHARYQLVYYVHIYVSDNSTVSENGESSQDVSGLMSIRFQNDNTTPEMYFNQQWSPICAHHFADNDFGAELFCIKLGINIIIYKQ